MCLVSPLFKVKMCSYGQKKKKNTTKKNKTHKKTDNMYTKLLKDNSNEWSWDKGGGKKILIFYFIHTHHFNV